MAKTLNPGELAKLAAETSKLTAEAREAELRVERAGMYLAEHKYDTQLAKASDAEHRVYRFDGKVSETSAAIAVRTLAAWDRLDPECDIEVVFNSPGGSVIDGMALFDQLSSMSLRGGGSHKVTTGILGLAASMAGILLQVGDVRWAGSNSYLMIHEISAGAGGKIGEIKDSVKFYEAVCEQVVDLFIERAEGKISRDDFVKSWERQDWWLRADEALAFGFVDRIK
jgi:ATP-dependent Clp endopeptidase proteolytic subunit ClpP